MRYLLIVIVFILSLEPVTAHELTAANGYSHAVASAELELVHERLDSALFFYCKAFKLIPKPFAIDIANALNTAILAKRDSLIEQYAQKLADKGVGPKFFEESSILNKLKVYSFWPVLIRNARIKKSAIRILNPEINERVEALAALAESLEKKWTESLSGTTKVRSELEKEIDNQFRFLTVDLIDVIDRLGYPTEERIGVLLINDTTIACEPAFSRIIRHSYSRPDGIGGSTFTAYLNIALDSGYIRPALYARLRDFQHYENQNNYGTSSLSSFKGSVYFNPAHSSLQAINENREQIGLGTLQECAQIINALQLNRKTVFQLCIPCYQQDGHITTGQAERAYLDNHLKL